jgi:hypothetical protein
MSQLSHSITKGKAYLVEERVGFEVVDVKKDVTELRAHATVAEQWVD